MRKKDTRSDISSRFYLIEQALKMVNNYSLPRGVSF